ncbi:MAG TPA: hypothetical protein VMH34_05305 [Gammaproteobacteria bacterium]|nr:hypothetical protein [Gammaproteobacteria bacterium]
MKIKLDINATPKELRAFFGMPDFEPLQKEWLVYLREKMKQGMENFDPAALLSNPAGSFKMFEEMQKAFWQQYAMRAGEKTGEGA